MKANIEKTVKDRDRNNKRKRKKIKSNYMKIMGFFGCFKEFL